VAETHLKILNSGRDKLVNIAKTVMKRQTKKQDELIEMNEDMQYNKMCI
jgi:hypothetical protein